MAELIRYLDKFTARKVQDDHTRLLAALPDSLEAWITQYIQLAVTGVRSSAVTQKIALHLARFLEYFRATYGHDRISTCLKRDIVAWQKQLQADGLAHSTINNHLASLSSFCTWVSFHAPNLFPAGDPTKGVGELGLPPLEPRALNEDQVRSLKNLCDRLERFHLRKGRKQTGSIVQAHARPWRDRAIVYLLLSTGLRREEVIRLDLDQIEPQTPEALRSARKAKITRVKGKGKTEWTVFLSADARAALADYLERERHRDAAVGQVALFLTAKSIAVRTPDGRLSLRAFNLILEQIGRWHDAEQRDPTRHISPLRPHDLRHTFAFQMEDASTEAIRRSDLDLILVDEGDWLNVESFEFLRHVFDRTGCPIVIVGLPRIMQVIVRHEKFVSRIGLQMEFLPLTQEEVLTTVLPALTLPYWQYHADDSADREMGIALWQRVCPSFRKLRVDLQYASQIARARQAERITPEILTETCRLTLIPHVPAPRPIAPAEERGAYEAASEQKPPRS